MPNLDAEGTMIDSPPGAPPMRASDADRQATVAVLQDAMTRGLLTPAETSDRMRTAFAATHLRDLPPIVVDLPIAASVDTVNDTATQWRAAVMALLTQLQLAVTGAMTGRNRSARWGAALLFALLLISCGLMIGHALFDAGDLGSRPGRFGNG